MQSVNFISELDDCTRKILMNGFLKHLSNLKEKTCYIINRKGMIDMISEVEKKNPADWSEHTKFEFMNFLLQAAEYYIIACK